MTFDSISRSYLQELEREYLSSYTGGQHTIELSFRPVLDKYFRDLGKELNSAGNVTVVLEPRNQGSVGRPDWRIHDGKTLGIFGYIEAKGLAVTSFDLIPYQEQIEKYITLGHKLIITDGIEFVFCFVGEPMKNFSLIQKTSIKDKHWDKQTISPDIKMYFDRFFSDPSPQHCNERELIEQIAIRTRILSQDLLEYSRLKEDEAVNLDEKHTITLLNDLKMTLYENNGSHKFSDASFSDFTAQIIMFSLLYAHRVICKQEDLPLVKQAEIKDFLNEKLTTDSVLEPFRKLIQYVLNNAFSSCFIVEWTEECIQFLSFVIMKEETIQNPDFHKLFEQFLAQYDPKSRFDYGAFYTPIELSGYIVKLVDLIVKNVFPGATIYQKENTMIDPCCGTGTFLEQILKNDPSDSNYNLCGFEIMPAPYMLANYRIALVNKNILNSNQKISLVLINTLSDYARSGVPSNSSIEGDEYNKAKMITSNSIKLIIGNPPSSDSYRPNIGSEFSHLDELMNDFRPPCLARRGRQNIQKQINNPHMQFLRWASDILIHSPQNSVLAFILPLSFLEAESYKFARKFMSENFSEAWFIALDADARTGVRNESLFNTLQGRAIAIFARHSDQNNSFKNYFYQDWTAFSKDEKYDAMENRIECNLADFSKEELLGLDCPFRPKKEFDVEKYTKFWNVSGNSNGIFKNHCSGIKLAPTALFTHVKKGMLKRRSKDILKNTSDASAWFMGQRKPPTTVKTSAFRQALINIEINDGIDALLESNIVKYSFRPFLNSNVLMWKDLLGKYASIGGGGTRLRPEIIFAFSQGVYGFAMAHAPRDLSPKLSQFSSYCWFYPDNDMCSRGNSHIYLPEFPEKIDGVYYLKNNIDDFLMIELMKFLIGSEKEVAYLLSDYVYAILCSQKYLDEFEGALYNVHGDDNRARIPITTNEDCFLTISQLGHKLALIESDNYKPKNLNNFNYNELKQQIKNGSKLITNTLDDENNLIVLVFDDYSVNISCPIEVQKLVISGYEVLKDVWLKFNSYSYTHCEFSSDDLEKLLDCINVIMEHSLIISEIDNNVSKLLADPDLWLLPEKLNLNIPQI